MRLRPSFVPTARPATEPRAPRPRARRAPAAVSVALMEGSNPICGAAPPNIPSVDFSGLFSTAAIRGETWVCAEDGNGGNGGRRGEKKSVSVSGGKGS
jgi:hypothetical protein